MIDGRHQKTVMFGDQGFFERGNYYPKTFSSSTNICLRAQRILLKIKGGEFGGQTGWFGVNTTRVAQKKGILK